MNSFYSLLINSEFDIFKSGLICADFDIRNAPENGIALAQKIDNLSLIEKCKIATSLNRLVVASNYDPTLSDAACLCLFASQDFNGVINTVERSIEAHGYIRSQLMAKHYILGLMCQARWDDLGRFASQNHNYIVNQNLSEWIDLAQKIRNGELGTICNSSTSGIPMHFLLSAYNSSVLATSLEHSKGELLESNELGILSKHIKSGNVLDIGCLSGNHSLYFSKVCGAKKVISIDTDSACCALTALNFSLNQIEPGRFSVINATAGGDMPLSKLGEGYSSGVGIYLDSDCEDYDLIKVDIDGGELELLKRSREYFRKTRTPMMCEVATESSAIVFNIMSSLGYECKPLTNRSSSHGDNNYLFTCV